MFIDVSCDVCVYIKHTTTSQNTVLIAAAAAAGRGFQRNLFKSEEEKIRARSGGPSPADN